MNVPTTNPITLGLAAQWLDAVVLQGGRTLSEFASASREQETAQRLMLQPAQPRKPRHMIEADFFSLALANSCKWTKKLTKSVPQLDSACASYLQAVRGEDARVVRNKREHFDQYVNEGGTPAPNLPKYMLREKGIPVLIVDPSSVVMQNGKLLIGGVIDVRACIEAANSMLVQLVIAFPGEESLAAYAGTA